MQRKLLKRKDWSDESGVSEIIGNILILMITVVLFSGIMMFVNQMPVPELTTKADFSASVAYDDGGTTALLTVTHVGGASMRAADTVVIVSIDQTTNATRLSEPLYGLQYTEWNTGIAWSKSFTGTTYYSSISVTVVDDVAHNAVWTSQVSGGMGNTPPSVLQRYVDSNNVTLTADPVKEDDNFTLFVKVADLDNDLDEVWVDSTSLITGSSKALPNRPSVVSRTGGWFEWDFINVAQNVSDVDGKILVIYATDTAGHTTIVPYKLIVTVLPSDIFKITVPDEPGEGGMPAYIKNSNEGQGFAIFGANTSALTPTADIDDPRTTFYRGEMVFIRAASTYVVNLDAANDLWFEDVRTGLDVTTPNTFVSPSTIINPFYRYPYSGNVAVYEGIFTTVDMMPGTYTIHATLSCTGLTNYNFVFEETLYVLDDESPVSYYPKVWTSNTPSFSNLWGTTKLTTFNATGENYRMYVGIAVQDAKADPNPTIGEVRVVDMTGGTQLYGPPGSLPMISPTKIANATAYYFEIDLRYHNGDAFKVGTNSYTLRISHFSDENEGIYTYSCQVFVRASSSRADFFVGSNGLYSSLGGSTNFISPEYLYFIENNNFFTTRTLYYQENAPSTSPLYYQNAMALGDLDNDGDMDLLVGSNMDRSGAILDTGRLLLFENTMNTYGIWQSPAVITRPLGDTVASKIKWIDTGDINGDGYTDFAYATYLSTGENKVWLFNNTYGAVGSQFNPDDPIPFTIGTGKDGVRKLALEDMNGDGRADLILLRNGRVDLFDISKWTSTPFASVPNASVMCDIKDFDIADVNCDGMLDVITVDDTTTDARIQGVWLNNYTPKNPDDMDKKLLLDEASKIYQLNGTSDGSVSNTRVLGGEALTLMENATGIGNGSVSFVFTVDTPLSEFSDQQLVVRASVSSGTKEVFYVWYSTDMDPETAKFTPIMVISGSTMKNYTYDLPASKAGSLYMYVKITDSSTGLGEEVEAVSLDYVAVHSNRFGSYSGDRYLITAAPYLTARAINFDGTLEDGHMEVVVAKNTEFVVYDLMYPAAFWTKTNLKLPGVSYGMYVKVPTGVAGYTTITTTSPTLFHVADINGDGVDDILTAWVSTGADNEISVLRAYINVGTDAAPWEVTIKDLFYGMIVGTEKGCIVSLAVGDIYNRVG